MGVFVQLEMGTQASSCLGGSLPLSNTLTLAESLSHSDKHCGAFSKAILFLSAL